MKAAMMLGPSVLLLLAATSPADQQPGFDGTERPHDTEVTYRFHCRASVTTLRYRQRDLPLDRVELEQARRVALERLQVSGRSIAARAVLQLEELFGSMAWIERVEVACFEGSVYLTVRAMSASEFAASLRQSSWQRPLLHASVVRIAADGAVTIS